MEAISPFIDASLRPDLEGTAYLGEDDLSHMRDEAASSQADAKRLLDSPRRA